MPSTSCSFSAIFGAGCERTNLLSMLSFPQRLIRCVDRTVPASNLFRRALLLLILPIFHQHFPEVDQGGLAWCKRERNVDNTRLQDHKFESQLRGKKKRGHGKMLEPESKTEQ